VPKITLSAARVNAGYTQDAVARLLGVAVSTIRNWEGGKTFPKQPMIEKMCDLYGIPYHNINFNVG
jgi:transcriptional regulator with XRE-family HTH domain